jgi:hypothetical protein
MRTLTAIGATGMILISCLAISADRNATSEVAKGWFLRTVAPEDYKAGISHENVHGGKGAAFFQYSVDPMVVHPRRGTAFFCTTFKADKYQGHRIRVTAYAKGEQVADGSFLWIALDGTRTQPRRVALSPAPMKRSTHWTKYVCVVDVSSSMGVITFGAALSGRGTIWLDDIDIEIVGSDVALVGIDGKGPGPLQGWNLGEPLAEPTNLGFEE